MELTKEVLINEIKTLQEAAKLHAKYSIRQYKKVLKTLEELEKEKSILEEKVKERTKYLQDEITQKENLTNQLDKIAKYDQLTGLANRYLFNKELEIIKKEALLLKKSFTIFFIDLDGFKFVNDTYGHEIGDELLKIIANKIKHCVRRSDLVSRLGGDEFTIIFPDLTDKQKIENIALNIINSISEVIKINNLEIYVGASIGIYIYNEEDEVDDILSKADVAMYEAKKTGKGRYIFFDKSMQLQLQKTIKLKNRIKKALKNKEFVNYFQPIVSSINYKIKSAEVLLRWFHDGEMVYPSDFIPILEDDINLIKEVTFWQIEEVIKLLNNIDIYFSINLSVKLLSDNEILEVIEKYIKKYKFDTSKIYFEVTETFLSTNILQASKVLYKLKEFGFKLSLDDFGTGYSSLAYLRDFPFDVLKVDKKFIDNVKNSQKDKKLLISIINLAKALDMKIVLEGIETKAQLKELKHTEYIKYQGYLFYKPLKLEELKKIYKNM